MSILVLSLLLLVLVGIGGLMRKQVAAAAEYFDNPSSAESNQKVVVDVSPALANLLNTPAQVAAAAALPPPQVDVLARDRDAIAAAQEADSDDERPRRKQKRDHKCPKCPKCPDMSQYIRLDEVPCWNCTLP